MRRVPEQTPRLGDGVRVKDLKRIQAALDGRLLGVNVHVFESLDSTNDAAAAMGRGGAPEGTLVIADGQTRGKGRLGRVWDSPPGLGLWFSVVLRPALEVRRAASLAMVGALGVAGALREAYGVAAQVKWPNDVVVGTRKICGVLAESAVTGDVMDFAVLGIGLNVHHRETDFREDLRGKATSVSLETRGPVGRAEVLAAVAATLEARYLAFKARGFAGIRQELLAASPLLGKSVRVAAGGGLVEGTAVDIDDDGALIVSTAGGERRLWAGEVAGFA